MRKLYMAQRAAFFVSILCTSATLFSGAGEEVAYICLRAGWTCAEIARHSHALELTENDLERAYARLRAAPDRAHLAARNTPASPSGATKTCQSADTSPAGMGDMVALQAAIQHRIQDGIQDACIAHEMGCADDLVHAVRMAHCPTPAPRKRADSKKRESPPPTDTQGATGAASPLTQEQHVQRCRRKTEHCGHVQHTTPYAQEAPLPDSGRVLAFNSWVHACRTKTLPDSFNHWHLCDETPGLKTHISEQAIAKLRVRQEQQWAARGRCALMTNFTTACQPFASVSHIEPVTRQELKTAWKRVEERFTSLRHQAQQPGRLSKILKALLRGIHSFTDTVCKFKSKLESSRLWRTQPEIISHIIQKVSMCSDEAFAHCVSIMSAHCTDCSDAAALAIDTLHVFFEGSVDRITPHNLAQYLGERVQAEKHRIVDQLAQSEARKKTRTNPWRQEELEFKLRIQKLLNRRMGLSTQAHPRYKGQHRLSPLDTAKQFLHLLTPAALYKAVSQTEIWRLYCSTDPLWSDAQEAYMKGLLETQLPEDLMRIQSESASTCTAMQAVVDTYRSLAGEWACSEAAQAVSEYTRMLECNAGNVTNLHTLMAAYKATLPIKVLEEHGYVTTDPYYELPAWPNKPHS